jgi:large subunit ribosomal protein L19
MRQIEAVSYVSSSSFRGMSSAGAASGNKPAKHKTPRRRASSLLDTLKKETFDKLKNGRQWPDFRSGDAIEVKRLPYTTALEPDVLKGVVIARTNRGADSSVTMINVEFGTPIVRQVNIYNPLIADVKVLEKAFIHDGKKRVRRSKLYYLLDRDPQEYAV